MRTGGGLVALGLAVSAAALAAPAQSPDILLSEGGVLEAKKPLTIGVRGDHGRVFVEARLLPDAAIARLYRDASVRRSGRVRPSSLGMVGVPAGATTVSLQRDSGGFFAAAVDLRPLIGGRRGAVLVEARQGSDTAREIFQVTDLGLLVVRSPIRSIAQVLRLSTGEPVPAATILTLDPRGQFVTRGTTDAGGLLTLDATHDDVSLPPDPVLIARTNDGDQVILLRRDADRERREDNDHHLFPAHTFDLVRGESIEAELFTDRGAFQRGEKIQVTGWAAASSAIHTDGLRLLPGGSRLRLTLEHGKERLATTDVALSPQGKLSGTLSIPANAPTGNADVSLELPLAGGKERRLETRTVRIEAVRSQSPAIELHADRHELIRPDEARLTVVDPTWRTGATATVNYQMACEPIWLFQPAGVPSGWVVGDSMQKPNKVAGVVIPRPEDARTGLIPFAVSTKHAPPDATSWCRVRATVPDSAGRERTAEAVLLVHPRPVYAALRIPEPPWNRRVASVQVFVRAVSTAGAPVALRGATIELDEDAGGALVPGSRRPLDLSRGQAVPDLVLPARNDKRADLYSVVVRDADGQVLSKDYLSGLNDEDAVTMRAPSIVFPGATFNAVIDERAGKRPGGGMLAIQGGGVQRALPLPGGRGNRAELIVVAGESFFPRVKLEAAVAHPHRDAPAELTWLWTESEVPESTRALEIAVDTPKIARAGEQIKLRAGVRRLKGGPVANARAAIAVVSEAVFSRGRYAELATNFYFLHHRPYESEHWDMFGDIVKPFVVTDGWSLLGPLGLGSVGHGCGAFEPPLSAADSRWPAATAAFFPDVAADPRGEMTVTFAAPATLGLYRVRVVASAPLPAGAPAYFGSANAWIDVR